MSGAADTWQDALLAAQLFALAPIELGGVVVRAQPGPVRDCWVEQLQSLRPDLPIFRKIPLSISESRLLGGLDLVATLGSGRRVFESGVLAGAHGQIALLPMAERTSPTTVSHLCAALDHGRLVIARESIEAQVDAAFGLVAFDESLDHEAGVPEKLADRLAFQVDLGRVGYRDLSPVEDLDHERIIATAATITVPDAMLGLVYETAAAFGVHGIRIGLHINRVLKLLAAINQRDTPDMDDLAAALRLCVAGRATTMPAPPPTPDQLSKEPEKDTNAASDEPADNDASAAPDNSPEALKDSVAEAVAAALPPDLLRLLQANSVRRTAGGSGRAGDLRASTDRGRPIGSLPGDPRRGGRIDITATLVAAAPWQALRRSAYPARQGVILRADDFRIRRFREPAETTIIFAVDASGSLAMNRLAEVKGAIELLLADCYVRRDEVALVVFRSTSAELLLPPTRSLVRAKRELQALPGGGGTPLAAGLELATAQADLAQRKGATPIVVVLTDGRANIRRDGSRGREAAFEDALQGGRLMRRLGARCILIDTSVRPEAKAKRLADEMLASYVTLPRADARSLKAAVHSLAD